MDQELVELAICNQANTYLTQLYHLLPCVLYKCS